MRMAQQIDETVVLAIRELLAQGQSAEAVRLFVDSQQRGVKEMIAALEALSLDMSLEEDKRLYEKDRIEFYQLACRKEPPFAGTFLRHSFPEDRVCRGLSSQEPGSSSIDPHAHGSSGSGSEGQ
jgi:hypothetical protein